MRVGGGWIASWIVALGLLLSIGGAQAQKKPVAATANQTRQVLIDKARALEARGRPDMAIQLWQQILLSDPNNADALAGLAKDYKLSGSADQAGSALDRLRKVNPNDPNIGKINAMASTKAQSDRLRQAGNLARHGKAEDAMRIYRELYGDHPPDGDIALAYYQTLYGTANGKDEALGGMRALAARNPGDTRFAIELGIMFTYDQRTRAEGIRDLQRFPKDSTAQSALRQALIWDAANPSSATMLREYLKAHPNDQEIATHLKENESKLAQMNSGIARTPEERAAFAALNAHKLEDAEARFSALLDKDPKNGRVAAGFGFLRMQQSNFGGAISYLTQAEQNGYKVRAVTDGLATSRFWFTMGEASQAFDEGQYDVAQAKYKAALVQRPRSPEALNGLAGLYVKLQQYPAAAQIYSQMVKAQPGSVAAWKGLFLAYARGSENKKAMETLNRFPASAKAAAQKDPEYLRTLATVYHAEGRRTEEERVLTQALQLPFPDNGANLKADTKLQYAGLLMDAERYPAAVSLYTQILMEDQTSLPAWMGLVSAHHGLRQDTQAIADVEKMPPAVYDQALTDPGFLSMLGAMYQQANQYEVAQGLLERSARLQMANGGKPSVQLQLQLAAIYLQRSNTQQAYAIYHDVLAAHPDNIEAWKSLIGSLQTTGHNREALEQIAVVPPAVRSKLESDIEFLQGEASLYAAAGETRHAVELMQRIQLHYRGLKSAPPAAVEVQNAWLLFNTGNDRALYPALMHLGGRQDLSVTQKETVQNIWANWSVRRAGVAMDNGNTQRAVQILDSAVQAFPENLAVRKAVAGGYARVGRSREAVALFKLIPMQDASAGDFQGAISSALAANDKNQAEIWLRQALDRYPTSPSVLALAARYEQARGDNQRAAEYWRASLVAMPRASAADKLAHTLVNPEQDLHAHKAATAADLQRLLNPETEPFAKTTKIAPLPAYGPDPYEGRAPVDLNQTMAPQVVSVPALEPDAVVSVPTAPPEASSTAVATPRRSGGSQSAYMGRMHVPSSKQTVHTPQLISTQQPVAAALSPSQIAPADDLIAAAPHTLAADSWKGLFFTLLSAKQYGEASQQLAQMPEDVRRELDADVEFVQGEASLYAATGDTKNADRIMHRVEDYYLVRRATAPASIEVQNAWLLYNTGKDRQLYATLRSLDQRRDLDADQRRQVESIWVAWSQRRALTAIQSGNPQLAVQIMEAATQSYPNDLGVRRGLAGAYLRAGYAQDALSLYKSISMQDAGPGEFSGAVSAALAAKDMPQAESWLRLALAKYPNDASVLSTAARFEQATGNTQRATEYWRASLAAMPKGSRVRSNLASQTYYPSTQNGVRPPAPPADLKQLLNPDSRLLPGDSGPSPLPGSAPRSSNSYRIVPQSIAISPMRPAPVYLVQHDVHGAVRDPFYIPLTRQQSQPMYRRVGWQAQQPGYSGQVKLPSSEENVDATDIDTTVRQAAPAPLYKPKPMPTKKGSDLRITAQPLNPLAARVQALFAEQTDGQLTQGSAANLRNLAEAPAPTAPVPAVPQSVRYSAAQYTPSAQEAATGAYSAQRQQTQQPQPVQPVAQPVTPVSKPAPEKSQRRVRTVKSSHKKSAPAQTLATMPYAPASSAQQVELPGEPLPSLTASETQSTPTSTAGLTDEELQQRNLPPLRGPWVRIQREQRQVNPRDEAEAALASIESGYSPWLGGAGVINYRSGDLGFDHLTALEAPFEVSTPLGYSGRFVVVGKPVFLDSGQADGTSVIQVLKATSAGTTLALTTIPQPIGTLAATDTTPPTQQNAAGIAAEAQLIFPHFAVAGGITPYGFLVQTFIARAQWRPGNGPFTFLFNRDSIKDTQLSYGGLRDPSGDTLGNLGAIWGGMIANSGNMQFTKGDAESGFYLGAGGQYITGYHVADNTRFDGSGGGYWRVKTVPEYGNLSIGVNFFGMHYSKNQDAFTWGMGGYFSPKVYFLANAPVTWVGHYNTNWHYNIMGSLGVQAFQVDRTKLFPEAAITEYIPAKTSVGQNYDFRTNVAYQISPHWFAGGFLGANNSRNYSSFQAGFFIRFLFRSQPSTAAGPTGIFPTDGIRPFTVP
jgi:tetratricopeptide (TPR) repeat protein